MTQSRWYGQISHKLLQRFWDVITIHSLMVTNQSQCTDGYSLSELFYGWRVRSYLPILDEKVNAEDGKATRELRDLLVKNATQTQSPLHPLKVGDLCYRRRFDGRKSSWSISREMRKICDRCENIWIRKRKKHVKSMAETGEEGTRQKGRNL